MFNAWVRPVVEEGQVCGVNGCAIARSGTDVRRQDAVVVFEVNGAMVLEMCGSCAADVGYALTVESRIARAERR